MRGSLAIGLALFGAAFSGAAWAMTSLRAPTFLVHVDDASATAPEGAGRWRVEVTPDQDRDRLTAHLDRSEPLPLRLDEQGHLVGALAGLSPGYHFIEAEVVRAGGRRSRVVDVVAAGPFQTGRDRGCDVGVALAPQVVQTILLPAIESKVIRGAAGLEEFFGPTSYIASSELTIVEGGVRVAITVDTRDEDKGDLHFAGVVHVESVSEGGVSLRLAELEEAKPGPKLERLAKRIGAKRGTAAGAGGGVTVGAFVGGPLGALIGGVVGGAAGHVVGGKLGERKAQTQTRQDVRTALTDGLAIATQELALPSGVELVATDPPLLADIQWCEPLTLGPRDGLQASFALRLAEDSFTERARAVAVWRPPVAASLVASDEDGVSVSIADNALNRLLAEWTIRGGFAAALRGAGLAGAVEAELGSRTRWKVTGIDVSLPPAIDVGDAHIAASVGDIALTLHDALHDRTQQVVVGGVGRLRLDLSESGLARIGGKLDEAYFGCRLPVAEGRRLPACFSAAIDPAMVRKKINLAILVNAARLPAVDLASLVNLRLVEVDGPVLSIESARVRQSGGQLRLDAEIVGEG